LILDVKIDEENAGKEDSKNNGKVGAELNLKGNSVARKRLNDGIEGDGRSNNRSNRKGSSGNLGGSLGN